MDKLIEPVSTLVSGAAIAVLASWLTSRARNHQEQQAEIGALRVQADAMTVAVMELQGAAAANRQLWEQPEAVYAKHPERFVRKPPEPPKLPTTAWINKPAPDGPLIPAQR